MRRAGVSVLLIVCLVTFLCPEVAKPNVVTVTKAPDCCSKMSGCKMTNEQTSHHDRCGHESQPGSCCTVSCSTLILFCPISEGFSTPGFHGHTLSIDDATAFARIERAADSAAADLILSHSIRLGAKDARTGCVFTQPRTHEISPGESYEIFAFDCSNYDADERDDDLVQ